MDWKDKDGKVMEIAYSTQVQAKLVDALERNNKSRQNLVKALNTIKWLMIVFIILGVFLFFYLDSRNAVTIIGRRILCPGL
jgi:hypothetical protein